MTLSTTQYFPGVSFTRNFFFLRAHAHCLLCAVFLKPLSHEREKSADNGRFLSADNIGRQKSDMKSADFFCRTTFSIVKLSRLRKLLPDWLVPGQLSQGPPFPGVTIPRVQVRVTPGFQVHVSVPFSCFRCKST